MDVNALFARAERAFSEGRLDAAKADLAQVLRIAGAHPAILHLLALVEKRRGALPDARLAFERALRLAPNDPEINNNFGNLLESAGELAAALVHFDRALAAAPAFVDARFNRALLLQRMGRLEEALAALDNLAGGGKAGAKVHSARAGVLRQLGQLDEAAQAYDRALRLEPRRLVALHGRARIAMERGEAEASEHYRRALRHDPGDLELLLGLAESLEAEGESRGLELLAEAVERHPGWALGHETLARMRSEAGDPHDFARSYHDALRQRPHDRELHVSHWQTLARAERWGDALLALDAAKQSLEEDTGMLLMEASFASEAGETKRALRLLDRAGSSISADLIGGRLALRLGDPAEAAARLGRAIDQNPDMVAAWAHLAFAWRMLDDPRHHWLCCQPGLYGAIDLGLAEAEVNRLAEVLRQLHRTRAHPIGQSLRGGTQTRGALFSREETEIVALREMIKEAVAQHMAGLPERDDCHPLLRHRDAAVSLTGSWSVRLTGHGFHVNHIHPAGILSSACYIALPETLGSEDSRDGWLEIGAPPTELKLDLAPLASVEPKPGRLALFPSYLYHGTRPFPGGERLTIAFDVGRQ